jgi:hypothetical protein
VQFITGPDPNPPSQPPNGMIDDMKDGNNQVIVAAGNFYYDSNPTSDRTGFWYSFQGGSTLCPTEYSCFFMDSPGYGGAMDFAAHMTGNIGGTGYPYTGIAFNMLNPKNIYDVTAYSGVSFVAKMGGTTYANWISVKFGTPETDSCGSDHYRVLLGSGGFPALTNSWQAYGIPLTSPPLAQEGYSCAAAWVPSHVNAMQFEYESMWANTAIDFWVDNITFY